jgi:hypothetical protein
VIALKPHQFPKSVRISAADCTSARTGPWCGGGYGSHKRSLKYDRLTRPLGTRLPRKNSTGDEFIQAFNPLARTPSVSPSARGLNEQPQRPADTAGTVFCRRSTPPQYLIIRSGDIAPPGCPRSIAACCAGWVSPTRRRRVLQQQGGRGA